VLSARNRELLGLVPSALLVIAGFTAIFIQDGDSAPGASTNLALNNASSVSLTYGALFLALCLAAHLVIRFALPHADPYLFPLGAVLASVGIVMVYRIDPVLARQQAQWMIVGLVLFAATILALRDRIAPPTLGLEHPDEGLDLDYVPGSAKPLEIASCPVARWDVPRTRPSMNSSCARRSKVRRRNCISYSATRRLRSEMVAARGPTSISSLDHPDDGASAKARFARSWCEA